MKGSVTAVILLLAALAAPAAAGPWAERQIAGDGLHGTLTLPAAAGPVPAVLILPGSGPVDRDGNLPGAASDNLKLLAHGLAAEGIAALRIDKRGIGASRAAGLREDGLRFGTYVADAVAWVATLRTEPAIARIVLVGHSEGALVATLAAQRTAVAGLVLLAGAGEPAPRIIARQLAAAAVPPTLQSASAAIAARLAAGQPVAEVPAELAALYRPSVQNYLMSWFPLDPAAELAKVDRPVLVVQGTTDIQVTVDDARRLAAARPGAGLVLVEGMNHVLKDAPAERAANIATYVDPGRPLSPALVPAIVDFVRGR